MVEGVPKLTGSPATAARAEQIQRERQSADTAETDTRRRLDEADRIRANNEAANAEAEGTRQVREESARRSRENAPENRPASTPEKPVAEKEVGGTVNITT